MPSSSPPHTPFPTHTPLKKEEYWVTCSLGQVNPFLVGKQGNMIRSVILFFPRNKSLFFGASNLKKNCSNVIFFIYFFITKDQTLNPLVEKGNFNH